MNFNEMKNQLFLGKIITRVSWSDTKRTIKLLNNTHIDFGKIGFEKITIDTRNNFINSSNEKIDKKDPINMDNNVPIDLLDTWNDDINDWFVVC